MVLLALRRGDGVAGGGPAQPLVLAHDAGGRVLRNHEAAVEAGLRHQVLGQAPEPVNELVSSSFRDTCQFAHGDGQRVHGNGDRLSVEVSGRYHHVLVREDIGIVRGRVNLVLNHGLHIQDVVLDGPVYLRDAAEAVRVLHMLLGPADKLAALQNLHEFLSRQNLSRVRAQVMRERQEGLDAPVVSVQGHGANQIGPFAQAHALEDAPDSMGAHELRAVQKGQALLALQFDGLPAHFFPYLGRRAFHPFVQDFAQADKRQAQVRQGSQVSGGAQGTLLVHHRQNVLVEHVNQALHGNELDARVAVRQGLGLQQQHQLHDGRPHLFPGPAGVRHHQVVLQPAQVFLGNAHVIKGAEARRNSVNGPVQVFHLAVQVLPAFYDGLHGLRRKDQFFLLVDNLFHPLQREVLG